MIVQPEPLAPDAAPRGRGRRLLARLLWGLARAGELIVLAALGIPPPIRWFGRG
ncbi:MAG: hypothetical protein K1X88_03430 [Nannocystaceae bacterium]|nr:hypothetical protein [Nannocystaceae bacterium]